MHRDDQLLAALLAPIADRSATGAAAGMRADDIHARIREARRGDDPRLPQGVWQRDRKRADWPHVQRLCSDALSHHAKDFLVAAWLVEAWLQLEGLAALPRGLRLIEGLCAQHWENLLPALDGGDVGNRVAPIEWLSDRIPILVRAQPLLRPDTDADATLTWGDYLAAQRLETVRQRDAKAFERAQAGGAVPLARVIQARERTPTRILVSTDQTLRQSGAALDSLSNRLEAVCGRDAPSLSDARAVLDDIQAFLGVELSRRRGGKSLAARLFRGEAAAIVRPAAGAAPETAGTAPVAGHPAPPVPVGVVTTREEACRELADIAALLRTLEPHSPTPYLIERALEWEQMPLPDLLAHVSSAGGGLSALFALLGLPEEARAIQKAPQDVL